MRDLIDALPKEDWLTRASLEARLGEVELEQKTLLTMPEPAGESAVIAFDGKPVNETHSIRADFAGHAIRELQRVFKTISEQARSELEAVSEAIPSLMIAGAVPGSFGFQLEESGTDDTGSILKATSMLLESAKSDDHFADVVQAADENVLKALSKFVRMLKIGQATVRLEGTGWRGGLEDEASVDAAFQRVGTLKDEEQMIERGTLAGLLPHERKFEFATQRSGELYKGTVPAKVFREHQSALLKGVQKLGTATFLVRRFDNPWSLQPRRTFALLKFEADAPQGDLLETKK